MRREGFELSVAKPHVLYKTIDGKKHEPFESLRVEVPTESMGPVMELVGLRRGQLQQMNQRGQYSFIEVHDPIAWPDRFANQITQCDTGHGNHPSPIRELRTRRGRRPQAIKWSHDLNGVR